MVRELPRVVAVGVGGKYLGGHHHARTGKCERVPVAAQRGGVVVASGCDGAWFAAWLRRHFIEGLLRLIFGDEVKLPAVGPPDDFLHVVVERLREVCDLARTALVKHEAPTIAFILGRELGVIGDEAPVRGIDGVAIERGICCDLPGHASRDRDSEEVAVGADGFGFIDHGGEADFFAIRRKRNIVRVATLIRGHVEVRAGGQIARRVACCRHNKEVAALAVAPVVPVTKEKVIINARLYRTFLARFVAGAIAGIVAAIGIDARREGDPLPVG